MSETTYSPNELSSASELLGQSVQDSIEPVELWDEADLFDDDSLTAAHAGAAEELLELSVRTDAERSARDDLASKALGLIVSAAESPFSDASRQMAVVQQLASRIGHLCGGEAIQKAIDSRMHAHNRPESDTDAETDVDDSRYAHRRSRKTVMHARTTGGLLLRPVLGNLRKMLVPFTR